MNKQYDHTFVICAYKESPFLEECLKSIQKQSTITNTVLYTSTPNKYIERLCKKYQIPIFTKDGGGIGRDWNNALSFVETKYATIVHQDDIYLDDYATAVVNSFYEHPDTLITYTDYMEWKNGYVIPKSRNLKIKQFMLKAIDLFPNSIKWRKRILAFGNPISCPAVTYNLSKMGNFKFDESMSVSLDWKAWFVIAQKKGAFRFINQTLMYHRIHEDSETSNSIINNSRTEEDLEVYKLFWPDFFARFLMKFYVRSQDTNK